MSLRLVRRPRPIQLVGGSLHAPSAPTIAGTVTIGGTLTITAGAGGGPVTSYTLYRDGVSAGTITSPYTYLAADVGPALTVKAVNAAGSSAASNTLQFARPTTNLKGDWDSYTASHYTVVSGRVSTALDQSGASNDLAQGTAPNRPVIATAGAPDGVHDAFDFTLNAGGAVLLSKADIGLGTGPVTIYTICQVPASGRYIHDGFTLNTRVSFNSGGTSLQLFAGLAACGVTVTAGNWIVNAASFNGASSKNSVNGGTIATGNSGASTSPGHMLGCSANASAALCLNAKLTRQLVYAAAHSDATMMDVSAYMKWWGGV